MSKICFLILSCKDADHARMESIVQNQLSKVGYRAFFESSYNEPLLARYMDKSIACSISDSALYDNCEMLLLPDQCWINGKTNDTSFLYRMKALGKALSEIEKYTETMELYMGESGTDPEDFDEMIISTIDFPERANDLFNNTGFPSLHFVFFR